MKKYTMLIALALLVSLLFCAASCGTGDTDESLANSDESAASEHIPMFTEIEYTTYIYEKDGTGGAFTITLGSDGSFDYYEGSFSSYQGHGEWKLEDGILTLTDKNYLGEIYRTNRFRYENDCLTYIAEGSDRFIYIKVADGDKFPLYNEEEHKGELVLISHWMQGKTFVSKGNCLTLHENFTFAYKKGTGGANFPQGTWSEQDGIVTLTHENEDGKELTAIFSYNGKSLTYIAEGSDSTEFFDISDGDIFTDMSYIEGFTFPLD